MGISYNKGIVTKDRAIMPRGPRDIQQRLQQKRAGQLDNNLVAELKSQIGALQDKLSNTNGGYTAEQVNELLAKTVMDQTAQLREAHQKEIISLKEIIKHKDEIISQLRTPSQQDDVNKLTSLLAEATKKIEEMSKLYEHKSSGESDVPESDRPQMETIFIDPIEKETSMEKHFDAEDVAVHRKEQHDSKTNKLKSLLGSLPTKK